MPTAPPGKDADVGASEGPPNSGDAARGVKANVGSGVNTMSTAVPTEVLKTPGTDELSWPVRIE
jgi:hypothetical protein